MGLRDLKRDGGYLTVHAGGKEWLVTGPGELARCPGCGRSFRQAGVATEIHVRLAPRGVGSYAYASDFEICRNSGCKARLEVRHVLRTVTESSAR